MRGRRGWRPYAHQLLVHFNQHRNVEIASVTLIFNQYRPFSFTETTDTLFVLYVLYIKVSPKNMRPHVPKNFAGHCSQIFGDDSNITRRPLHIHRIRIPPNTHQPQFFHQQPPYRSLQVDVNPCVQNIRHPVRYIT